MDHIWPIWQVQVVLRVHGELVPSSGNTRRTRWQRSLPGVYPEFPQYHRSPEMEPMDTAGVTTDDVAATKKSAKSFLDHLASQMDHTVSQRCGIYQLKDVWIKPVETPDELVDHLRALADRCNFPKGEEKEWNVQFCLVCALTDSEFIRKLLTLDLKDTTAKLFETCRTHIAIADNLHAMGLGSKTVNAVNKWSQWPQSHPQQQQQKTSKPQNQHAWRNCTKSHAPGRAFCPAKDSTCQSCGKIGHWDARCWSSSGRQKDPNKKPPRHGHNGGKQKQTHAVDVGNDYDPQWDEVSINTTAINIDALNEAWATVTMPAEIGPNHCRSLWCKVNTGVSSNVMPLCIFAKLFPSHIITNGKQARLCLCKTRLTAYNGSNIPQFGSLDTSIE